MQKLYYLNVTHPACTSGTFEINCCKLLGSGVPVFDENSREPSDFGKDDPA